MKCNELWLREWVNPPLSLEKITALLTHAGLEVESISPVEEPLSSQDWIIDIAVTPNRGDCLSVRGIARELSSLTGAPLKDLLIKPINPTIKDALPVKIENPKACPNYVCRIIRNINTNCTTPTWLSERLKHCGIALIHPIVDVMNYVMLEIGQPMHAFDLKTIEKQIVVRQSKKGETITLLDGSKQKLNDHTLIIADTKKPLAIAGVMGGLESSVTSLTTDILLESAFFDAQTIAEQRQRHHLNSDSAHRFERGVDPSIQKMAIERATQLILEIAGGQTGKVTTKTNLKWLPQKCKISIASSDIEHLLGIAIPSKKVDLIFHSLFFSFKKTKNKWLVTIPLYRFDLRLTEDLIEEAARLYGYANIPSTPIKALLHTDQTKQSKNLVTALKHGLQYLGYHEIINYSFIDSSIQKLFDPNESPFDLINPITNDMTVMRTNLWPGLIQTMQYNKNHQQHRIRLFEVGTCFLKRKSKITEELRLGGLISGFTHPEQWGLLKREVDFFDIKGDIETLLHALYPNDAIDFKPIDHLVLHPGQGASILHQEKEIGLLGMLHPAIHQKLDLTSRVFIFELNLSLLTMAGAFQSKSISKFPEVRRDLALLIDETIPAQEIQDKIKNIVGSALSDSFIFDIYQGKGIPQGLKSVAIALIFQDHKQTFQDQDINELMDHITNCLKEQLGAQLRS